jgi:hypothetical protein
MRIVLNPLALPVHFGLLPFSSHVSRDSSACSPMF